MHRITAAIIRRIATAAIRGSWAILGAAESHKVLGQRLETWAHGLAARWGCVDDVLDTLTNNRSS